MTHPVVYAIGLGVALGAAIFMYFAHDNRENNYQEQYLYVPRPPPPTRPSNQSTNSTGNGKSSTFDADCTICLEPVIEDVKKLKCSHIFHGECISKLKEPKCPNCRKNF